MRSFKEDIRTHIARDDLIKAIDMMINIVVNHSIEQLDEAILLSRELYGIQKAKRQGVLNFDKVNSERNKITLRMLSLLNEIYSRYDI